MTYLRRSLLMAFAATAAAGAIALGWQGAGRLALEIPHGVARGGHEAPASAPTTGEPGDTDGRLVFTVAAGTGARVASGQDEGVWPETVVVPLKEADTVVIQNDDSAPFQFGSKQVAPGESFEQQFTEPGVYVFLCNLHQAGKVRFVVLGDDDSILGRPVEARR